METILNAYEDFDPKFKQIVEKISGRKTYRFRNQK